MALVGTDRGTGTHNTSATTFTLSPASNFGAGLAVLCVAADNAHSGGTQSTVTVTDTLGNTWTRRVSALIDPGAASAGQIGAIFTSPQNGGLLQTGTVITVDFNGDSPTAKTWTLMQVAGTTGTPVFITQNVGTSGTGTTSPTITTSSIPVNDMVIAALFLEAGTTETITQDGDSTNGSWSTQQTNKIGSTTSGSAIASQRKVQTTTPSAQTYNPTLGILGDLCLGWIQLRDPSTVSSSFTANAILKKNIASSFTGDAILRKTQVFPSGGSSVEQDLFQPTPTNSDVFGGFRMALSGDGQVMAVAALAQTKVYIANYPFSSWTALTAPSASPSFVALSYDGSVCVIGDPAYNPGSIVQNGRAFVYSGASWGTQTILNRTNPAGSNMGNCGTISDDNSTIVLGGSGGSARVYVFNGASWGTQTVVTPAASVTGASKFIYLSTDMSTIVWADATFANGGSARGRVLVFNGSNWATETQLTQTSPVDQDRMGNTLVANRDCSVIVAGYGFAPSGGTNRGKLWAFYGSSWGTQHALAASDQADGANFGQSAAVSNDGTHILVGALNAANGGTNRGKAYVYNGSNYSVETGISSVSPVNSALFGSLVQISDDGSVLFIAAVADGTNSAGSISVCSGASWATVTRRMPSDAAASNGFANSTNGAAAMPISRSPTSTSYAVATGAPNRANGGTNRGEAYWFGVVAAAGLTLDAVIAAAASVAGSFTANAVLKKLQSATLAFDAIVQSVWDWVSPPANGGVMSATPTLTMISPNPGTYPEWFQIQLDTSASFNTGNLRTYRMGDGQGTWEYFNGSIWVAMPSDGLDTSFKGNQVRFTVPVALAAGTWYRRFRYQVHA